MLGESLLALATLAGRTVVDAAATDRWETAERGYAKLLGQGNARQTQLAEQWLEETREQLTDGAGADMELICTALAARWAGRWADLLEENPDAEADLRALVQEIQAARPAGRHSASNHAVSADGDVSTYAAGPEHPGALAARSELAYSVGQAGDAAAARDQFAALLSSCERSSAPSTLTPWPLAPAWPTGSGRRGMRPPPGTNSPHCCPYPSTSSAPSIPTP